MNVVLLRVGVDSGSGGIQGPLFADGSFELIPIPDNSGVGKQTYGNTSGCKKIPYCDYFPISRRTAIHSMSMHVDPEFETFTYGDPTSLKAGLRRLQKDDMLVFYAGLTGWDHTREPALYLIGYFEIEWAGLAADYSVQEVLRRCGKNFHVMHSKLFDQQRERLVLVKGGPGSRLLRKAHCISTMARNVAGQPIKVLSNEAQDVFSNFGGHLSIQRSPPRWVPSSHAEMARKFVISLT